MSHPQKSFLCFLLFLFLVKFGFAFFCFVLFCLMVLSL
jgi:hypothetical protein